MMVDVDNVEVWSQMQNFSSMTSHLKQILRLQPVSTMSAFTY